MTFSAETQEKLRGPLDMKRVKQRQAGGNRRVSYMPTFAVKQVANEIFGPGGWDYQITDLSFIGEQDVERWVDRNDHSKGKESGWRVAYRARVKLTVGGTVYEEVGFGDDTDYASALAPHELAVKEAVSDALKRAFMNFGDPFGLPLWDKESAENRQAGGARGNGAQPAAPVVASDAQVTKMVAAANEHGFSDEQRHRIVQFVTGGATYSTKQVPKGLVTEVLAAFQFVADHPDTAWLDIEKWEAEHPAQKPEEGSGS